MSKKRFTETTKWKDSWFMDLNKDFKLFWIYLLDECDNCGVWDVNMKLARFLTETEITDTQVLETFKDKIIILEDGKKWLIPNFIKFQYGDLKTTCKPHLAVIKLLKKHDLLNLFKGSIKGMETLEEEDKEKKKETDKYKLIDKNKYKDTRERITALTYKLKNY